MVGSVSIAGATYLVVHPAVPVGRNHGGIVLVAHMIRPDHPAIAAVEVVRILKVFVAVLVLANEAAGLQIVGAANTEVVNIVESLPLPPKKKKKVEDAKPKQ